MRKNQLAIIVLLMLLSAVNAFGSRRPNVLIVLVDDLGYSDLGCYGSSIETPNIDSLASNGLRYSNFYNTGRCWTTRASLMTGLYQHQVGKAMSFGEKAPPAYQGNIPRDVPFLSELLQAEGYRTYHLGKWHLNSRFGEVEQSWPLGRGFEKSYCIVSQNNFFAPWVMRDESEILRRPKDPKLWPKDYYITNAITDRAVGYLQMHFDSDQDAPFFMYLAHTAPHFPLHAPQNVIDKYRHHFEHGWDEERRRRHQRLNQEGIVVGDLSPRDATVPAWSSLSDAERDKWAERMAIHAAMVDVVDVQLGRVLELLEKQGELDNTLIMFLSDNGASAESLTRGDGHDPSALAGSGRSYLCLEVGWSNAANTPFREHKMWIHEGGIATPLILHWPKGIRKTGEICHQVGHVIDVIPTIADIAGLELPETVKYQGTSLARSLRAPSRRDSRVLFWEHIGNKGIRIGDLKAVQEHGKPWELYNLANDRMETNDLAELIPSMLNPLKRLWREMAQDYGVVDWDELKEFHPNYSFDYRRK